MINKEAGRVRDRKVARPVELGQPQDGTVCARQGVRAGRETAARSMSAEAGGGRWHMVPLRMRAI